MCLWLLYSSSTKTNATGGRRSTAVPSSLTLASGQAAEQCYQFKGALGARLAQLEALSHRYRAWTQTHPAGKGTISWPCYSRNAGLDAAN